MKRHDHNPQSSRPAEGVIVAHYGVAVDVRLDTGELRNARVKRNSGHVVGDRVRLKGEGLERLERRNALRRRSAGGNHHVIGVNLDVLGIVVACVPETPRGFIDRALVAARAAGIRPFLVVNKADLEGFESLRRQLADRYGSRFALFPVCAARQEGLAPLRRLFAQGMRGAFVGTSGVGKSRLLNTLMPDLSLRVGDIRESSGLGRHTTTVATLHRLPDGGELVDTPGFRDFGLVDVTPLELATHFPDFDQALAAGCRFRNCLHHTEPDCAVRRHLEEQRIAPDRYEAYLEMLRELRELEDRIRFR